jgi:imidazolonepropionase-like amidohydrolase
MYRTLPIVSALACMICACGGSTGTVEPGTPTPAEFRYVPHLDYQADNLVPTASEQVNVVLRGATIMTATGETITDGSLWMRDGEIAGIGDSSLEAPDATEIDVSGKWITPGIIDTHSHLGVYPSPSVDAHADGNEATAPTTAGVEAINSVWPQDPGFQKALAGGITVLHILPGSANIIGGGTTTLQLHPGVSSRAMLLEEAPRGIKMACGENPKRVYGSRGGMPSTRMGNHHVFRQTFQRALEYRRTRDDYVRAWKKWRENEGPPEAEPKEPTRDFMMEPLVSVLDGDTLVHVHCYRADEMIQILQLAEEFGFDVRSFHHAVEAYKIRDILAVRDVSVSTWADWWGFKIEAHDAIVENAGLLTEAGARAIIHSDSDIGIQRLNQEAAKAYYQAVASGLAVSENDALRWITANAAWALGIDDITGTLEVGKRADVVVWSAHPFSVYARAEHTFVEGVHEWDASRDDAPWSDFEVGQLPPARQETP